MLQKQKLAMRKKNHLYTRRNTIWNWTIFSTPHRFVLSNQPLPFLITRQVLLTSKFSPRVCFYWFYVPISRRYKYLGRLIFGIPKTNICWIFVQHLFGGENKLILYELNVQMFRFKIRYYFMCYFLNF